MGEVVTITRAALLERLAEIDALLDIMESHDVNKLYAERRRVAWLLRDD